MTLTISIDRTGLSLSALEFSGADDATDLGIVGYQPPSRQSRVTYAPDSINIAGSEAIGGTWQQAILGFDWVPDRAASESDVQTAFAEVVAAVGQFSFTVTTQVSGAPAQVWAANMGSATHPARTYVDLSGVVRPVFSVSIPVYPIPGS